MAYNAKYTTFPPRTSAPVLNVNLYLTLDPIRRLTLGTQILNLNRNAEFNLILAAITNPK